MNAIDFFHELEDESIVLNLTQVSIPNIAVCIRTKKIRKK